MAGADERCYLGFDFSTQQLKAIVVDENLNVTHEAAVQFDTDLPEFRTHGGIHKSDDGITATAPTLMWVKALDIILEKLKLEGLNFSNVTALSGCAQQHGSVYWKKGANQFLKCVSPEKFLHQQLQDCFALRDSPVWMDSSTSLQCKNLEFVVGGPEALAIITGSRGYERFTGNQIAKIFETKPTIYQNTERISLVSSFAASLFLGDYASIDLSDGSGMNLLDIFTKEWSDVCLQACAPNLKEKLGTPIPSFTNLGRIAPYFVERYGFDASCKVIAFTGDNPASLAGLLLKKGDMGISLGTSDTLFLWISEPKPSAEGHILCNPVDHMEYMALLCFKNGSSTRERIRNECAEGSWEIFTELLESTPRGNFGNIGMYFDFMEIIPPVIGDFRFNKSNAKVQCFSKEVEVRAVIESHFLSMKVHAENLGFKIEQESKIIATGGASVNKSILQVLSDVFNAPVFIHNIPNSACLGAAYRAKHGSLGSVAYHEMFDVPTTLQLATVPAADSNEVYEPMAKRLQAVEASMIKSVLKSI